MLFKVAIDYDEMMIINHSSSKSIKERAILKKMFFFIGISAPFTIFVFYLFVCYIEIKIRTVFPCLFVFFLFNHESFAISFINIVSVFSFCVRGFFLNDKSTDKLLACADDIEKWKESDC